MKVGKFFLRYKWVSRSVLFLSVLVAQGQDAQFSQYYAAPLYLNPGMTGINQYGSAGINYRNQWPSIAARFETTSFYIDNNFDDYYSSVGLLITQDREGIAGLQSTNIGLIYAYQAQISPRWTFRPGLQIGYSWRDINFNKLTFGDQFDNTGLVRNFTGEPLNTGALSRFFDVSFGSIFFSPKTWVGLAVHHINQPNQSLIGEEAPLMRKISLHAGHKFSLSEVNPFWQSRSGLERSLTPTFNYRRQDSFQQLDIGVYLTLEPVILGTWYRGLPVGGFQNTRNSEALIVMFGLVMGRTTMAYSFDYTLSDLGIDTGGAHEISIKYAFNLNDPRKPPREVRELKCPVPFIF